jgi:hypothetical protein
MLLVRRTEEENGDKRILLNDEEEVEEDDDDVPFMLDEKDASTSSIFLSLPFGTNLAHCASALLPPFLVRGKNYLIDRKKCFSEGSLFPFRGADLFLAKNPPEHIGRHPALMDGKLREKPTFLVNFRLPWGTLILYFEIPERFLPFLHKRYEPAALRTTHLPSLESGMSPAERCVARFLVGDDDHKKQTLKILPRVADGPWVVKSVVGNAKPAIIGNKLPVKYFYQSACKTKNPATTNAAYLEADLDIAASGAARKILSVVRSATQGLTFDVGFVCEGKQSEELPEQMMIACRLKGVDPLKAPPLPPLSL